MTHFQLLGFRIQALARLGLVEAALEEGGRAMLRARDSGALQAAPAIELALMIAEFVHGDLDAASIRAHRLLEVPQLHTQALVCEVLARIALLRDEAREADEHAQRLTALAQRSDSPRHHALGEFLAGGAAALSGDASAARERMHGALATFAQLGLEREAADVLEELALLAVDSGEGARAARLAAAAAATRARLRCEPLPGTVARLAAARTRVSEREGANVWKAAWQEGSELSLGDAIAYARRRRGRRDRPPAGWASLTPAELEVAQLAASGMSNPQIAEQLFIARSTVKMHLSSVYGKLHVVNRTELATAIATHVPDLTPPIRPQDTAAGNDERAARDAVDAQL
jgi:DNA-binding CsgD family transcriptional regulator